MKLTKFPALGIFVGIFMAAMFFKKKKSKKNPGLTFSHHQFTHFLGGGVGGAIGVGPGGLYHG
jgi:uncharacterized membrane protein YfcA